MPALKRHRRGCVCCRKPYDGRPAVGLSPMDLDANVECGLYELLHSMQLSHASPQTLEPSLARQVASFAKARAREAARCQSPGAREANKPLMAPFELEEVKLGPLLGVGGFSNVYEILGFNTCREVERDSFTLSSELLLKQQHNSISSATSLAPSLQTRSKPYSKEQQIAREFLAQHALRCTEEAGAGAEEAATITETELSLNSMKGDDDEILKPNQMARYALKHLRPSLIQKPEKFAKSAMDLACEAEMMLCLDHPHIVKLRGWGAGGPGAFKDGKHNSYFLIVDRLLETLQDRIWMWRKRWKKEHKVRSNNCVTSLIRNCLPKQREEVPAVLVVDPDADDQEAIDTLLVERVKVAYDISCALEYLHEKRIIYRDLKSANIGFDIRGDVKIFDFGLSRFLPTKSSTGERISSTTNGEEVVCEEAFRMSNVGTRRYTAPEVTEKKPYNLKADVYSFGVVVWEMLTLCSPVSNKQNKKKPAPKHKPLVPCCCWPESLQQLVQSMLATDPSERPTMTHVRTSLKHILMAISDSELSAEIMEDVITSRRRSTFRLESFDMAELGLKDDFETDDPNLQSHTSVCTSFST